MAKKYINPVIMVPWFDTEGMKQRSYLKFTGECDERLLIKAVTLFIKENFCNPPRGFVKALIKANLKVLGTKSPLRDRILASDQQVEDWIKRIQDADDATEDTTDQGEIS